MAADPQADGGIWVAENWQYILCFVFVIALGGVTGAMELVARYRDDPLDAAWSTPGKIYIGLNALLSAAAFTVLLIYQDAGTLGGVQLFELTMLAGFGALLFFRARIANLRVGENDISVGPSFVLDTLLSAVDNAVARGRAIHRDRAADEIMAHLPFSQSRSVLTPYCLALLNNPEDVDEARLGLSVAQLADRDMPDGVKARIMAMYLLDVAGEDVLRKAVATIAPLITVEKSALQETIGHYVEIGSGDRIDQVRTLCQGINPATPLDEEELGITILSIQGKDISELAKDTAIVIEMMKVYSAHTVSFAAKTVLQRTQSKPPK